MVRAGGRRAAELFAWAEEFEHLKRACRLWPRVSPGLRGPDADRAELVGRTSDSAIRAGAFRVALDLREDALRLVDRNAHPLEAARLSIHLGTLRGLCGISAAFEVEPDLLALTTRPGDLPERAIALAKLALVETDADHPVTAARYARDAVRVARRSGSDEAMAWALGYRSQLGWGLRVALEGAEEAVVHARASGDHLLLAIAAGCLSNCLSAMGYRARAADRLMDIVQELWAAGAFYESVQVLPAVAQALVDVGRWDDARHLLREVLSRRIISSRGGDLRRVAADLAARAGDLEAARQHVIRARELVPNRRLVLDFFVPAESRVAIAVGDQVGALSLIAEAMPAVRARDDDSADELLLWGARAAADPAGRPGEQDTAVSWLEELERLRGDTPAPFASRAPDDLIHPAWQRLHAAEAARCRDGGARRPDLWEDAALSCASAELPWEQALAEYRHAQSLLAIKASRARAAAALREAARISRALGASPLLADVEALAKQSHIPLTEPAPANASAETPAALACLTPREREVLRHLVAGRTYAEIARELFISEKTVSVHVSNLLRKTNTSSRIEVTELARHPPAG